MTVVTRILILTLLLWQACAALAQETTASAETATETATDTASEPPAATESAPGEGSGPSREAVREELSSVLNRHPPEVGRILSLDPTLLANEQFLGRYPDVAEYIARHPEVRRNPHYFIPSRETIEIRRSTPFEEMFEAVGIFSIFALIAFALGWVIRTIIEQKRWNRLSRTQFEVHNKLLDRFGTSEEVLAYIRSPAGAKFLESAPIPLHSEKAPMNTPFTKIMWSIQLGVVAAVAATGMILLSFWFSGENRTGFFAIGAIGLSIGLGFIASAIVSLSMSKRFGLLGEINPERADPYDQSGGVR